MESVVVFGCGREAERFLSTWSGIVDIRYFLNNSQDVNEAGDFHGYKVFHPSPDTVQGVIVVTPAYYYDIIRDQLGRYGLIEQRDFFGIKEYIHHLEKQKIIPERKQKRVGFVGFAPNFDIYNNEFINTLSRRFDIIIDQKNPEYVFCSMWGGYEYLKYDGVRIFYSGENFGPDFNYVDYAIGYNRDLHYEDRFFRELPFNGRKVGHETILDLSGKTGFCNFIYSHERDDEMRRLIFEKLGKYKRVDSLGTYLNNMPDGFTVTRMNKIANTCKYKFSIAFESVDMSGFVTEKISDAFDAGTIPVYLGDPHVCEIFNEEAFINCNNYESLEEVVKTIIELDSDDDQYIQMLNMPVFNEKYDNDRVLKDMQEFLFHIFEQDYDKAFRRGFGPSKHVPGVLSRGAEMLLKLGRGFS